MGREDHGAAIDLVEPFETIVTVDQLDAVSLQLVGDVRVVNEIAEHADLLAGVGFGRLFGGTNSLDHAVAITTGRDLENVHRFESTRAFRARTDRAGYEWVTGLGPGVGRSGVGGAGGACVP